MITREQYFQAKPHDAEMEIAADDLLVRVNELIADAEKMYQIKVAICPNTGTMISGSKGGAGDGGFRLPTSTTGSTHSSHKEARAVDVYDEHNRLDEWLDQFDTPSFNNIKLEQFGLYREAPSATPGWCHLTTRAPGSGRRTFNP